MRNIPSGWVVTSLRELVSLKTGPFGSSLHESDYVADVIPIINPMHIEGGRILPSSKHRISIETAQRLHEFKVQLNDIVIGRRGEMGRCAVVKQRETGWLCGTESLVIRSASGLCADFLQRYLSSDAVVKYLLQASVGSTMANLNQEVLTAITVILPPTQEQTRIVDKLEELLSDLDAGVAELKAAQKKLAQYRQSLLKAAVEGKLTEAWRAQHGEPEESGAQLLARILRERRAWWEAKQLVKFEAQGKAPVKGWQGKYPEPMKPKSSELPALPRSWTWATIDELSPDDLANGRSVTTASSGAKILRLNALKGGAVDLTEFKLGAWSEDEAKQFSVCDGDLLIARGNGSLKLFGRAGLVAGVREQIAYPDTMIRLRLVESVVRPAWIGLLWDTSITRTHIERQARTSAGIYKISQPDIVSALIPVPPLAEQDRLLAVVAQEVEQLLQSQQSIENGLRQSAAQRKNILQAAFSGQLVVQDPNDEPASALLERIRAERAASGIPTKARGRKKKEAP